MSIKKAILKHFYATMRTTDQKEFGEFLNANSISDAITLRSLIKGSPCADISISTVGNQSTIPDVQTNLAIKEDANIPYKYTVSGALEHIDDLHEVISAFDTGSGYLFGLWLKLPYAFKHDVLIEAQPDFTTTSGSAYTPQFYSERKPNPEPDDVILPMYIGIRDSELVPSASGISLDLEIPMELHFFEDRTPTFMCKIDLSGLVFKDLPEDTEGSIVPDGEGDDSGGGK